MKRIANQQKTGGAARQDGLRVYRVYRVYRWSRSETYCSVRRCKRQK